MTSLQTYISHKRVQAAEIISVGHYRTNEDGKVMRSITIWGGEVIDLPGDTFSRYTPSPGDAYIVYEDGYKSFSPRKAFLEGYATESECIQREASEADRLRAILRQCVRGADIVDLGNGETLGLHLAHKGESFADIKAGINKRDLPASNS